MTVETREVLLLVALQLNAMVIGGILGYFIRKWLNNGADSRKVSDG